MKARPTRQELIKRLLKQPEPTPVVSAPKMNTDMFPAPFATTINQKPPQPEVNEPDAVITAFVEVGLTRHPLECYRYTIYDQIRS